MRGIDCHMDSYSPVLTSTLELENVLSNSLVIHQLVPYIPITSLLSLGGTSRSIRSIIYTTPGVFRYLNLSNISSAQFELAGIDHGGQIWRNVQLDENVTEDDFYGGPLRGIFGKLRKQNILGNVQTMILDGLSVPSDLVSEIILQDSYNVKVLSIRDVKHLNEGKLQQALKYAVRASRPEGTPKLQALYLFGPRDPKPSTLKLRLRDEYEVDSSSSGIIGSIVHAQGAQIGAMINIKLESTTHSASLARVDKWYRGTGKVLTKSIPAGWEATLMDCEGIICFDAVLCRGPRHSHATVAPGVTQVRHAESLPPRAANISVRGCHSCGTSPEGFAIFGKSSSWHLPLLAPAPLHASTQKASISPFLDLPKGFLARCTDCMRARFCESCYKWWCEDCYTLPDVAANTRTLLATSDTETDDVKVHMGLCVDTCLAPSMMAGAGSNGLWG